MEDVSSARQEDHIMNSNDVESRTKKPSRDRQSKSCAQKKMEKHRRRINKIVMDNYQKYLKMRLACYSNFDLTYVEALDGTKKFNEWWEFHLTQPLGLALLAECAEEDSEEMISVAAYDEAVGEEEIHIDIVEPVAHDNILIIEESAQLSNLECDVTQSERPVEQSSDEQLTTEELAHLKNAIGLKESIVEHQNLERQSDGVRRFIVRQSKQSRPEPSVIIVGNKSIMHKAPTEAQKVRFKTRSCSRYCNVPSLALQCICDVDQRTAQSVFLYKFLGKCNHLDDISVPYCTRTPGWTIPTSQFIGWGSHYDEKRKDIGPREKMIGKLAIMLHRQPIESLLTAWILLHNTKDQITVKAKVYRVENPIGVGACIPPRNAV